MKKIKTHLTIFILVLALSGITAFPIKTEIAFLYSNLEVFPGFMMIWISKLKQVIDATPDIMFYGTDWLAFAHIVIGLFFIPVFTDPRRYKANIIVAMIACLLIFPLAFICGPVRGIPFFHQLIDCAFGLLGFLYLLYILKKINQIN